MNLLLFTDHLLHYIALGCPFPWLEGINELMIQYGTQPEWVLMLTDRIIFPLLANGEESMGSGKPWRVLVLVYISFTLIQRFLLKGDTCTLPQGSGREEGDPS